MNNMEIIDNRLTRLTESMKLLRGFAQEKKSVFLENQIKLGAAKYYLLEAIQVCLDIGNHIIGSMGWERPQDYASVFRILQKNQVLPKELADKLEEMARFRNRIVHLYGDFDNEILYSVLNKDISDIDSFATHIVKFMKTKE
ncbi:MAG: type VII toxin-antitoxin system HepT family RNase toxin [Candidatus Thorarchaeota archaeon]